MKENSNPDVKIFLIGNKLDLENERQVEKEEAEKMKYDYGFSLFMESSAKSGMNVKEIFVEAAKLLYKDYNTYLINDSENNEEDNDDNINLAENIFDKNDNSTCCRK